VVGSEVVVCQVLWDRGYGCCLVLVDVEDWWSISERVLHNLGDRGG
jgi:hypothetical protein